MIASTDDILWIEADKAVRFFGKRLVGLKIMTEKYGEFPGGTGTVIKLMPDSESARLVMDIKHDTWRDNESGIMGIFSYELIGLLKDHLP